MITIFSGGSGNDAILKALLIKKNIPIEDIKIIVNAYDNGKSTGVCRDVTSTLGVSDIRKNHYKIYKYTHKNISNNIEKFYKTRLDLNSNSQSVVKDFLIRCDLENLVVYSNMFFNLINKKYNFNDFSVSNIIYSVMYKYFGYEYTNRYFCNLIGIPDCVVLNSFDNVYIDAITKNGSILKGEENIVDYCNDKNKIKDIIFNVEDNIGLNRECLDIINNSDTIIISTGTFWSSIYPTLFYKDLYKYINKSKANKYWFINSEQDKDAYGISSNDFIDILSSKGLDLKDFLIIENTSADNILKLNNNSYNIKYFDLGNYKGKNDYNLISYVI